MGGSVSTPAKLGDENRQAASPPIADGPPSAAADDRPLAKLLQFDCDCCGSNLCFEPGTHSLRCVHCGTDVPVPPPRRTVPEQPLEEVLARPRAQLARMRSKRVRCGRCGAETTTRAPSGLCPFCGTAGVTDWDPAEVVPPDGVVAFALTASEARETLRSWIQKRRCAPSSLRKLAAEEALAGVYLPLWTFDCQTRSKYTGMRGDAYYETVTHTDSDGNTSMKTERRVRWSPSWGETGRRFDDVSVAATNKVPRKHLDKLNGNWGLDALEPLDLELLAGFVAHYYDVDLPEAFARAKAAMRAAIEADCRRDIGGDEQQLLTVDTSYFDATCKHVLVPVWTIVYYFRGKPWHVYVNGRTGEVSGDRPYSLFCCCCR